MSRGLSWRQREILASIAQRTVQKRSSLVEGEVISETVEEPVAWRDVDYGPTSSEADADYFTQRVQWNIEQATRRALRSLEQRGLVTLGSYVFHVDLAKGLLGPQIKWAYTHPDNHIPGDTRIMTGAMLTTAGWVEVRANRRFETASSRRHQNPAQSDEP